MDVYRELLRQKSTEQEQLQSVGIKGVGDIKGDCILCFEKFTPAVSQRFDLVASTVDDDKSHEDATPLPLVGRQRAQFQPCGHANVCLECATRVWKEKKKVDSKNKHAKPAALCPVCRAPCKVKPEVFKVFL